MDYSRKVLDKYSSLYYTRKVSANIKIILIVNMIGLVASFVARRFIKNGTAAELIPNVFLYLSAILALLFSINSNKTNDTENKSTQTEQVDTGVKSALEVVSPAQKELGKTSIKNDLVEQELSIDDQKISISSNKLLQFGDLDPASANKTYFMLQDSEGKNLVFNNYDQSHNEIISDKFLIYINNVQKNYTNQVSYEIHNIQDVAQKLTCVTYLKLPKGVEVGYTKESKEGYLKAGTVDKLESVLVEDKYSIFGLSSDWDSVRLIESTDYNIVEMRKTVEILPQATAKFATKVLTGPRQNMKLAEYEADFGHKISWFANPVSGLFGIFRLAIFNPIVFVFEYLANLVKYPLIAMLLLILLVKLALAPLVYQGHGFGKEFHRVLAMGATTKNQEVVVNALLNNKALNIQAKVISVVFKIGLFMILYNIFSNSVLFYGAKLLWINNLGLQDKFLPLITTGILYFEMQSKNTSLNQMPQNQQMMNNIIILGVFLFAVYRMPAICCLYLLFNSTLDNLQNSLFDLIKSSGKKIAKS